MSKNKHKTVGDLISSIITDMGTNQRQFGFKAGISGQYLGSLRAGKKDGINIENVKKISKGAQKKILIEIDGDEVYFSAE